MSLNWLHILLWTVVVILGNAYLTLFFKCGQNSATLRQCLSAYQQAVCITSTVWSSGLFHIMKHNSYIIQYSVNVSSKSVWKYWKSGRFLFLKSELDHPKIENVSSIFPQVLSLSRSCILSKWINIFSKFFTFGWPHHSCFSISNVMAIFRRGLLWLGQKLWFFLPIPGIGIDAPTGGSAALRSTFQGAHGQWHQFLETPT